MPLNGKCLCGKVQVEIADSNLPLTPLVCHCKNCQTTAGSVLSLVAVVDLDNLKITGTPKEHKDSATHSGNTTSRFFCGDCGAPVHTQGPSRPGKTVIKLGLFAQTVGKVDKPAAEIFTINRNDWETPIEGAAQSERLPQPKK